MLETNKILSRFSSKRKENEALTLLKHAFNVIDDDANDNERIYPILHALHELFLHDANVLFSIPILQLEYELQIDHDSAINLFNELKMHCTRSDDISWIKNLLIATKFSNDKKTQAKIDQLHGLESAEQEYDTAERRRKKHLPELNIF